MPDKFTAMSAELHRYAVEHSHGDDLLERLTAETEAEAGARAVMQTAPEQAALMTVLVRACGAKRALELGTFTGYGSIAIARGLPADGTLISCDISEQWTAIARRYWQEAGLAERIELRIGPALETLAALDGSPTPFDFVFIDADKESYPAYYEACVGLLRRGGLLLIDNVFRGGAVLDGSDNEPATVAVRELNDRVAADERVAAAMTGIADGLTFAVKL